ncbi:hypothetical protein KAR91_57605, partial [Candidatus Pacearchaeota archaeon]|nr:hypothetical protein [Candidatus Pacearchaeota archaeon]
YGPGLTDVYNNLVTDCDDDGIEISLAGPDYPTDPNSVSSATEIKIEHNLIKGASYGITVWGVNEQAEAGLAAMVNNCFAVNSTQAVYLSGWMGLIKISNGYYGNGAIGASEADILPVYPDDDPFVNGVATGPYYIVQDCNMVDAAYTYDEVSYLISAESIVNTRLIGKTTSETGAYDSGVADIGYHYQGWEVVTMDPNLVADIDLNDIVNLTDFSLFSQQWLNTYDPNLVDPNNPGPVTLADFDNNGCVDVNDLMTMASQWLYTKGDPYADIDVTFDQEVDNIVGHLEIGINVSEPNGIATFLLLDGEVFASDGEYPLSTVFLDSSLYSNGEHSLRVFCVLMDGKVVDSEDMTVNFNNILYYVAGGDYFDPNDGYQLSGFYDGVNTVQASVLDMYGVTIWSNDYSGPVVHIDIPGSAFSTHQLCELAISETSGAMAPMSSSTSSSGITKKDLVKKFDKDSHTGTRMLIIMPHRDVFRARRSAIIACAEACDNRNVSWTTLYHHDVTEGNLRFLYGYSTVKYIYWCGHANAHIGDPAVARTHTICWERTEVKWLPDRWEEIGVFSWTNGEEPLPNDWDNRGVSLWSFGMHDSMRKKIVFVDGCLSGVYSDMAQAYGVYSLAGYGSLDQIYIGWRNTVDTHPNRLIDFFSGDTTEGVRTFWERLGLGHSVQDAFEYIDSYGSTQAQKSFFVDTIFSHGENDNDDNIVIGGHGAGFLDDIELGF